MDRTKRFLTRKLGERQFTAGAQQIALCWLAVALTFAAATSHAQAPPPITSSGLNTQVSGPIPINGNTQYNITGGTRPGGGPNLFHSFGEFSVPANNIANFLNDAGLPTSNILGRVTGGSLSSIFGTIQTEGFGSANLFLMNPAGFLFGSGAQVNAGGMVTFTTADYMRLEEMGGVNAGIFHADPAQASILTSAPVVAFGFLGSNPGAITVQGSQLAVAEGTGISLIGGDITIQADPDTGSPAAMLAPAGEIRLASAQSTGEFRLSSLTTGPNINADSFGTMGAIIFEQGTVVDVSGDPGGTVHIRSGHFVLDNSFLIANTTGGMDGAPTAISVQVDGLVSLANGSAFSARAQGAGLGGGIEVNAVRVELSDGSLMETISEDPFFEGLGSAGFISVTATESVSVHGVDGSGNPSDIRSDAQGGASTGPINVNTSLLSLFDGGTIETRMAGFDLDPFDAMPVRAMDITLDLMNLDMRSGGVLRTVSGSDTAPSGNIFIRAMDAVTLIGTGDFETTSRIMNENGGGATGVISVNTGRLVLADRARFLSDTFFDPDPGSAEVAKIRVSATDSITLGTGSRIDVNNLFSDVGRLELTTHTLKVSGASIVGTQTSGTGRSGQIVANVHELTATGGSQFLSISNGGFANGGDITLNATGTVSLTGQGINDAGLLQPTGIFSSTIAGFDPGEPIFTGNAGNVSIFANGEIRVADHAQVDSSSQVFAYGNAGMVKLKAPTVIVDNGTVSSAAEFIGNGGTIEVSGDIIQVKNSGQLTSSARIRAPLFDGDVVSPPSGKAGDVTVQGLASPAQSVLIDGAGSGIFTTTEGTGAGGNIFVDASKVTVQNRGTLSASSAGTGDAGNININAGNLFTMNNSSVSTEAAQAGGGDIKITTAPTGTVHLTNSTISASVADGPGGGGNISIDPQFVILQNSQILARAAQGQGGKITIVITNNGLFLPDATSVVNADSGSGVNGTVDIQSPISQAGGKVVPLSNSPVETPALLGQRCAALASAGQYSSFVVAGRDTVPTEPGGWLVSPLALSTRADMPTMASTETGTGTPQTGSQSPVVSIRRLPAAGTAWWLPEGVAGCGS